MKKLGSILLTFAVLLTLCAGALPVYAEDTSISITSAKTVLMVGQSYAPTVTVSPSGTSFTLSSSNSSVVSVDNTYKTMTGLKKGTAVITASCTDSSGNVLTDSITVKVRAPTGLINDTDYYIMNCNTELLLSLETASDANNVNISGRARSDTSSYSQWTVLSQSNGTTRLQSVYSSAGRVIFMSGTNAILYNSTSAYTKFDLHRIESGTYQGKYLIRFNNKYLTMDSTGDVYLSSSLVAGSYWCFMAVEKGYADMISFNYYYNDSANTHFDNTSENGDFETCLTQYGYTASANVNDTVANAHWYLKTGDMFIYYGHGAPAKLVFETTGREVTGKLYAYNIQSNSAASYQQYNVNSFDDNELALQRCVLYLGCSTGVSETVRFDPLNLVDETFEKGAHFVLGLSEDSDTGYVDAWLDAFLTAISKNNTISGAITLADRAMYNYSLTREIQYEKLPTYTAGDSDQYLN